MKALFSIVASFVMTGVAISQTQSTVTVNTTGNRNKQIVVDSKYYTINNTSATDEQAIVITDLSSGQHTLQIVRKNQYNKNVATKTIFTLQEGYDLTIAINSNGAVSSFESHIDRWGATNTNKPITNTAFNRLITQTKAKASSTLRTSFLENEFTKTNKRFTSKQASQLIQLINSESLRFKLSKESYTRITDTENFALVSNLLKSSSNRIALNNYIASLPDGGTNGTDVITMIPITDEKFRIIYNEANAEPSVNDKSYYLSNFFDKDFNYYTSSQASQFIQLVSGEQERFDLAKAAYRGVTDRQNYGLVSQLLNSSYNRTALISYINTFDNTVKTAMSTADFNSLYQSAYYINSSSSRYAYINTAFTKAGNYFTVAQAKKIIPLVSNENSRLLLSKEVYKVLVDRANYVQFNEFLTSTAIRNDFSNYVANYDTYGMGTGVAMSETEYNKLYNNINSSWSSSTKVNLATEAFRNAGSYFTVYQVRQLLLLISSENDRLVLAKNSYDNIVDPTNYTQLFDIFNTSASKNDLANFVAGMQNGTGTTVKIPMTGTEFNSISRDVQFTFGLGAKMNSLTDIFNKETNYFTVQQARQLIQMVSAESNRLELAKSSYNNITDPANFNQLYDIFSTQTSKDELAAYVGSSAYLNR